MRIRADLHGHTLRSDAHATPEEFVEQRRFEGLQLIAITDHDVFGSVKRGAAAAKRSGLTFLPAVECTTTLGFGAAGAEQIHVLAYFPPSFAEGDRLEQTALHRRGKEVERRWKAMVLEFIDSLPEAEQNALDRERSLGALAAEIFPAIQATFDQVAELDRPELLDRFRQRLLGFWSGERDLFGWTPQEAMETIRADGAIDVVAHPARYHDQARVLPVLREATGIEVYTARHKPEVAEHFRQLADALHKLWTTGSDDHQHEPYCPPSTPMPEAWFERLIGGSRR